MTVVELIDILCHYPQDMRVVCTDGEYADYFDIHDIYIKDGGSLTQGGMVDEPALILSPFDDGKNR